MSLTIENFSLEGNIPEAKDRLHIYVKGELVVFAHAFNTFVEISSYSSAFKDSRVLINFSISLLDVNFILVLGTTVTGS
jgi:hypothetical protein